ncbi:MAG: hypothetical protein LBH20_08840 [Treponema sp.]|jgi:hypothetical protein|nr:hypothetical protein [Treponema sp.]
METALSDRPPPTGEGLTFEKVWAMFQENERLMKETWEKNERKSQEIWEKMRVERLESKRQWEEERQEINRIIGDLSNRFGELAEHLVAPNIHKRFNELGYHFDAVAPGGYVIRDGVNGKVIAEVDILLENEKYIMAVEVKAKTHSKDIEHHIKRLDILRQYRNKRHDTRIIQGAIAGAIFGSAEKQEAIEAGFYVLEQSGDTVKMDIPDDFVPREW